MPRSESHTLTRVGGWDLGFGFGGFHVGAVSVPISSVVNFQTDVRSSHSDLDAVLWARQRFGGSIDMVYLGGLVFSRERVDVTQTFPTGIRALAPSGGFRTTLIDYGTRPLV